MIKALGYGNTAPTAPLDRLEIDRRDPGPKDVRIEILWCGICHSDLHTARNEWHGTTYPCIPGHEIVGRVSAVGADVKGFKAGDLAGVGCMVDSCRTCPDCKDGLEQFCRKGAIFTYNSPDAHLGGMTYGGYSNVVVVDEAFVLRVPDGPRPRRRRAAPLRRHHDLLAAPPLGRRPREEGRHRRPRRPRPHGGQARARDGRARRPLHDVGREGRRTRSGSAPTRSSSPATRTR